MMLRCLSERKSELLRTQAKYTYLFCSYAIWAKPLQLFFITSFLLHFLLDCVNFVEYPPVCVGVHWQEFRRYLLDHCCSRATFPISCNSSQVRVYMRVSLWSSYKRNHCNKLKIFLSERPAFAVWCQFIRWCSSVHCCFSSVAVFCISLKLRFYFLISHYQASLLRDGFIHNRIHWCALCIVGKLCKPSWRKSID